jgi:hypothetical protein
MWSWILAAVTIAAVMTLHRGTWPAWLTGFAAEIAWIAYGVLTEQYGFVVGALVLGIPVGASITAWWRAHPVKRVRLSLAEPPAQPVSARATRSKP